VASHKDLAAKAAKPSKIDGYTRTAKIEAELNELAVSTFGRGNGAKFFEYLKQISTAALGPEASDAQLRHQAGMRHMVYIINCRIDAGRKDRQDV